MGITRLTLRVLRFVVLLAMAAAWTGPVAAESALEQQKACDTCYGANGKTKGPLIPRLAGQLQKYLEKQIRDFGTAVQDSKKDSLANIAGSRAHPKIKVDFKRLTDEQITKLAGAYAAEACFTPASGEPPAPARAGTCLACHYDKATSHGAWVPRLSGQNKPYLTNQIYALQIAKRSRDDAIGVTRRHPVMEDQVGDLTTGEVEQLAGYFSRRRCR